MIKFAEDLGRRVARRQMARSGRLAKTPDAIKRELAQAGSTKSTGDTFNYPKGSKV